ncbi:MAG: PAS domain S-box protein, partial [Planctomycetota bacterium]|nr:PAS domain S-box protein [Planctomycetota bacterium]
DQVVGQPWGWIWNSSGNDDPQREPQLTNRGLSVPQEVERLFQRRNGTRIWVHVTWTPIREPGNPGGFAISIKDIDARIRAEEVVRAQKDVERAVLDSMTALVAVLDATGEIRAVNRAWILATDTTTDPAAFGPTAARVGGLDSRYPPRVVVDSGTDDRSLRIRILLRFKRVAQVLLGLRDAAR